MTNVSYFSRSSSTDRRQLANQFLEFLPNLTENQKYDHLRLPLQLACLISLIFLLGGLQIHKAKPFFQRYKLVLVGTAFSLDSNATMVLIITLQYSKCLGN